MKYFLVVLFLLTARHSFSQDCSKELLKDKPGTWKAGPQGMIANVSAADLAKEKATVTTIHKMVSNGYKPTGCQVTYCTVYGKQLNAGENWISDPYYYEMYILRYLCEPESSKKPGYYVDHATPTKVNVTANVVYSLGNLYAAGLAADDFRGYLKMKTRPVFKDGYYYMGEEVVGNSHLPNKIKEYRWLITYNDTLPFTYVNRREYLLLQKKRLEKDIEENPSEKVYYEEYLKNISEYLKRPAQELDQPAICMWNEEQRFEKFVPEGTLGSFIAVKPNLAYYRKKVPKSAPQFFTVVYTIAHGDPVFEENMANIKKAVDFAALKALLGK